MNQAEFHTAVRLIAAALGRTYFCSSIEATESREFVQGEYVDGRGYVEGKYVPKLDLRYRAYIDGYSWHDGTTADETLESLRTATNGDIPEVVRQVDLTALGETPALVAPEPAAAPDVSHPLPADQAAELLF